MVSGRESRNRLLEEVRNAYLYLEYIGESGWGLWVSADLQGRLDELIVARTNVSGRGPLSSQMSGRRAKVRATPSALQSPESCEISNHFFFSLSLSLPTESYFTRTNQAFDTILLSASGLIV
ncbi:hypothetical protein CDAR_409511 [Caerostris darwini]|uniref:Uncharacterized protein n=1 Tax=Caerostris darwini TaxID=1538125 RepID=A0AAV4S5S7_9ARAC|nr:hypothetical protein CDAR_409511 [Caerostris darwini]